MRRRFGSWHEPRMEAAYCVIWPSAMLNKHYRGKIITYVKISCTVSKILFYMLQYILIDYINGRMLSCMRVFFVF